MIVSYFLPIRDGVWTLASTRDQAPVTLNGDPLQADDIRALRDQLASGDLSFDSFEWTL